MAKKGPDYQTDFVALLNNNRKARDKGFVVFVYGENSLRPFQDLCFQQSYNSCLTVRYRSSYGRVPG